MNTFKELMNGNSKYVIAFPSSLKTFETTQDVEEYYKDFLKNNANSEVIQRPMTVYIVTPIHCFNPGDGATNGPPTDGGTPVQQHIQQRIAA